MLIYVLIPILVPQIVTVSADISTILIL